MKNYVRKWFMFTIFAFAAFTVPLACDDEVGNISVKNESYDLQKLQAFMDVFNEKMAVTKTADYLSSDKDEQLEILLKNTPFTAQSFKEWAKSLNIDKIEMVNARTATVASLTDEQSYWIGRIQTETEKANTKEEVYALLDKISADVGKTQFKSDKTPVLVALNVAKATVEKAFKEYKAMEDNPAPKTGRVAACGFWRWTCIIGTTATLGALGYIAGGLIGGGVLAVAAYDIAKCCICCPFSCKNAWFCFTKPDSQYKLDFTFKPILT